MKLRTLLAVSYVGLIAVPFAVFFSLFYFTSRNAVLQVAQSNIHSINQRTNELVDEQLRSITESSRTLMIDRTLYEVFCRDGYTAREHVENDRVVTSILNQYFLRNREDYSVSIVTPEFVYGSSIYASTRDFYRSQAYRAAEEGKGSLRWIPTWTLQGEIGEMDPVGSRLGDVYRFTAVQQMNLMNMVSSAVAEPLPGGVEKPVLLISFNEEYIRGFFDGTVALEGFAYCVSDREGKLVIHSGPDPGSTVEDLPWLEEARVQDSGIAIKEYRGERMVVCYTTSGVTGWITAYMVPFDTLLGDVAAMGAITPLFVLVLVLVTLGMAYIVSLRVTRPIHQLSKALSRAGEGELHTRLEIAHKDEIGELTASFNSMGERLQRLIDENYRGRLRQREAELLALNTQLNPHFLYNTLNIINMEALDCDAPTVSDMILSLSRMLRYTVLREGEMALLREDLEWLENYVTVMSLRHGERYRVDFRVEESILELQVPRLFLQPLLENAMLHGMHGVEYGGEITVAGEREGDFLRFTVGDNGRGMEREELEKLRRGEGGVGMGNVDRRIRLVYGEEARVDIRSGPGQGTEITLWLPIPESKPKNNPIT